MTGDGAPKNKSMLDKFLLFWQEKGLDLFVPYLPGQKRPYFDGQIVIRPSEVYREAEEDRERAIKKYTQIISKLLQRGVEPNVAYVIHGNPENIICIDVDDVKKFNKFLQRYGHSIETLQTLVEKTPHGYHIFFRCKDYSELPQGRVDELGVEIFTPDTRKMITITPSYIKENGQILEYKIVKLNEIVELPDNILQELKRIRRSRDEKTRKTTNNIISLEPEEVESIATDLYYYLIDKKIYENAKQQRHRQDLFLDLAKLLAQAGILEDNAVEIGRRIFRLALEDKLEDDEREWKDKRIWAILNTYRRFREGERTSYHFLTREQRSGLWKIIRSHLGYKVEKEISRGIVVKWKIETTTDGRRLKPEIIIRFSRSGRSLLLEKNTNNGSTIETILQGVRSVKSYALPDFLYVKIVTDYHNFEGRLSDVVDALTSSGYLVNKNYQQYLKAFLNAIALKTDSYEYFDGFVVRDRGESLDFPRSPDDRIYLPIQSLKELIVDFFSSQVKDLDLFKFYLQKLYEVKKFFENDESTYFILLGYSFVAPVMDIVSPNFRPALIVYGTTGSGKSTMCRLFGKLFVFKELDKQLIEGKRPYTRNAIFSLTNLHYYFDDFTREMTKSFKAILTGHPEEVVASGTDSFLRFKLKASFIASTNLDPNDITSDPALMDRIIFAEKEKFTSPMLRLELSDFLIKIEQEFRRHGYDYERASFVVLYLTYLSKLYNSANKLRQEYNEIKDTVMKNINSNGREADKLALVMLGIKLYNRLVFELLNDSSLQYNLLDVMGKILEQLKVEPLIPYPVVQVIRALFGYRVRDKIVVYVGSFKDPEKIEITSNNETDLTTILEDYYNRSQECYLFLSIEALSKLQQFNPELRIISARRLTTLIRNSLELKKYFDKKNGYYFVKIDNSRRNVLPIPLVWLEKLGYITKQSENDEKYKEFKKAVDSYPLPENIKLPQSKTTLSESKNEKEKIITEIAELLNTHEFVTVKIIDREDKTIVADVYNVENNKVTIAIFGEIKQVSLDEIKKIEIVDEGAEAPDTDTGGGDA